MLTANTKEAIFMEHGLTAANNNLRLGWRVGRSLDSFSSSVEDPGYPIGFGQNGTVTQTQGESESDAQDGAGEDAGLGQNRNGHQIAE